MPGTCERWVTIGKATRHRKACCPAILLGALAVTERIVTPSEANHVMYATHDADPGHSTSGFRAANETEGLGVPSGGSED